MKFDSLATRLNSKYVALRKAVGEGNYEAVHLGTRYSTVHVGGQQPAAPFLSACSTLLVYSDSSAYACYWPYGSLLKFFPLIFRFKRDQTNYKCYRIQFFVLK